MNLKRIIREELGGESSYKKEIFYIIYSDYIKGSPKMGDRPHYAEYRGQTDWRWYRTSSYDKNGEVKIVGQNMQPATYYDSGDRLEKNDKENLETLKTLFTVGNLKDLTSGEFKPKTYKDESEAKSALSNLIKWVDSSVFNQQDLGESGREFQKIMDTIRIVPIVKETRITAMDSDISLFDKL
jgi:hypothetical protein